MLSLTALCCEGFSLSCHPLEVVIVKTVRLVGSIYFIYFFQWYTAVYLGREKALHVYAHTVRGLSHFHVCFCLNAVGIAHRCIKYPAYKYYNDK